MPFAVFRCTVVGQSGGGGGGGGGIQGFRGRAGLMPRLMHFLCLHNQVGIT